MGDFGLTSYRIEHGGGDFQAQGSPFPIPCFGLAGVHLHTYTGWGSVTYWNAYVANTQMNGLGTFYDPRLKTKQFPVGSRAGFDNLRRQPDLITSKLAALHFYQLAIPAPTAPEKAFNQTAAARGQVLFGQRGNVRSVMSRRSLQNQDGHFTHLTKLASTVFKPIDHPTNGTEPPRYGVFSHE